VSLCEIQPYPTTHLTPSGCRSGGNIVEAANDAENAGGPCDGISDLDANSCMSWSEIINKD
jgi:hypothetical protein